MDNQKSIFCKQFGSYVKHLRKLNGMSQIDLADKLGNNYQNISSLERGEFAPTLYAVSFIAKAFEMSLGELIIAFEAYSNKSDSEQEKSSK